jgi:retron-type reverse transcriptase
LNKVHYAAHVATIRGRMVQTAAKIVLEPIFEADLEDSAYGYRPRHSAIDAVKETHRLSVRKQRHHVNRDYQPWLIERTRLFAAMDTWDGKRKRGLLLIE